MKQELLKIWCWVTFSSLALSVQAQSLTQYTYNDMGLIAQVDGPRTDVNDITRYEYTSTGLLSRVINANGHITSLENHTLKGKPQRIIDPNGLVTELIYDLEGNVVEHRVLLDAGVRVTQFNYVAGTSLIANVTYPNGNQLSYQYDHAQRVTRVSNGLDEEIEFDRDANGNVVETKVRSAKGTPVHLQRYAFDELSRVIKTIGAYDQIYKSGYDENGNVVSTSDANQNPSMVRQYDELNRLIKVTDPVGGNVQFGYNKRDQVTRITDPKNHVTTYEYDGLGHLLRITSPDTGTARYTNDPAGNLTKKTDNLGNVTEYSYDQSNRVLQVVHPSSPELDVTYQYDSAEDGNAGLGRLTSVDDASGTTHYIYDLSGAVLSQTSTVLGSEFEISYAYHLDGSLASLTYPSGREVIYSYDGSGRLTGIDTRSSNDVTQSVLSNITYLPFGPSTGYVSGNGIDTQYSYDLDYQLTHVTNQLLGWTYQYDANGNIEVISDQVNEGRHQTFGYDALDRLVSAQGSYGNISYSYDPVGNRLTKTREDSSGQLFHEQYVYDSGSNRLLQVDRVESGNTTHRLFSYDSNGQIVSDSKAQTSLDYNADNRLERVTNGSVSQQYLHNYQGQRVASQTAQGTVFYLYDLAGNRIAEMDHQGHVIREYIYFNHQAVALAADDSETLYFVHNDHLGTPKLISDGNQDIVWSVENTPFGVITETENTTLTNIKSFSGQYRDETGYSYNYFRDYDPSLGRYIQSDPIGLRGGLNTYAYVYGNPLSNTDPYGLAVCGGLCIAAGAYALFELASTFYDVYDAASTFLDECSSNADKGVALGGLLAGAALPGPGAGYKHGLKEVTKNADLLRTGGKNATVNVKTKAEADKLLNEAFPDYQKVNGVGPQDAAGIRKKRKMDRFKQGGAYHKDYAIDPATGRVRGHGPNDAHGEFPHINIKRTDGTKVIINITGG